MIIYPAIDLSQGSIVRLTKGNFNEKKVYNKNVIEQVKLFQDNGAKWIHVVDLDGALLGRNKNEVSIEKILRNTNCRIQMGGGIRTLSDIEKWVNFGVDRIIIGTSAIIEDDLVKEAVKKFPKKISVGLDLYNDYVAIRGWTETVKEHKAEYYFKKFSDLGVCSIIFTDINKDGVLKGPNFKKILKYKKIIDVPIIASGGVANIDDIKRLYSFNIEGVIVGKALYDNKIKLDEIFKIN